MLGVVLHTAERKNTATVDSRTVVDAESKRTAAGRKSIAAANKSTAAAVATAAQRKSDAAESCH